MATVSPVEFSKAANMEQLYELLAKAGIGPGWNKPEPSMYPTPKKHFVPAHWPYRLARAAQQVNQVFLVGIGHAMGQRLRGESHEITGADFDFTGADFGEAMTRQNVDEFFVAIVGVELGGVVALFDTHQMHTHLRHANRITERFVQT